MVCKCGHIFRETSQLPSSTLHSALFGVIIDLYLLLLRWYTACLCLGVFDVIRRKRASAADVECNAVFLSDQNKFTSGSLLRYLECEQIRARSRVSHV